MRDACILATESALTAEARKRDPNAPDVHLTVGQANGIEARVNNAIVQGQKKDPVAWRGLTRAERITEGGKLAAEELQAEAAKKKQRLGEAIMTKAFNDRYLAQQVAGGFDKGPDAKLKAMRRLLVPHYDGLSNTVSVEEMANGYFADVVRRMENVFETIKPGLFKNLPWDQPEIQSQMRRALAGITKDVRPEFIKMAKEYHDIAEEMRVQFNAAGGIIGKLENWDQPHSWSDRLVHQHGLDQFIADMIGDPASQGANGWVDRAKYVHENGSRFDYDEMREFFKEAGTTILSGFSKESASRPGGAMKANRHGAHREIHILPEHTEAALKKYSERNVLDAMTGHLRQMSRDIALVQRFGPSADAQFTAMLHEIIQEMRANDPVAARNANERVKRQQNLYDHLAGNEEPPASKELSDAINTYRTIKTGAVLGSAVLTSISDHATMFWAALSGGLNPLRVEMNTMTAWAPQNRRYAKRMGLMTDTMVGQAQRFSSDNLTARETSTRISSFMLRRSGLNFLTEIRRVGYAITMMDAVGRMTRKSPNFNQLHGSDKLVLMGKGIDQATWDIWRAAKLDKRGANHTVLTAQAIMDVQGVSVDARRRAAAAFLGVVKAETDLGVIEPGARERAATTFGTRRGTPLGELARSVLLFKSFPWAYMTRFWERSARMSHSNFGRLAVMGALSLTGMLFGVVANWMNDLARFQNPRNMNPFGSDEKANAQARANWISAWLKGGGFGVFSDFLFNEINPSMGQSAGAYAAGPLGGDIDLAGRLGSNLVQAANGNEPDNEGVTPLQKAGVRVVQGVKGVTPGASLPYVRGLLDRYVFNALLELIEPGYLDAVKERQQSQQGTTYFVDPAAKPGIDPVDSPDLAHAWQQ